MERHKVSFQLKCYLFKGREVIHAKKELPFEVKLASSLVLDELCYMWNKQHLETQINEAIDKRDQERFMVLSQQYKPYTYE
ncbi:IDEAL domain-containing protein [Pontibacillus salicampi]|uniref:IDEAL domain-containing protein n=1 Tax=Pontibacillus salicampi TaxID=1449801 RepID=A0ABV6LM49_9BACI